MRVGLGQARPFRIAKRSLLGLAGFDRRIENRGASVEYSYRQTRSSQAPRLDESAALSHSAESIKGRW